MTPILKWFCIISILFSAQVKAADLPFPDIKVSAANTEKANKDIVFRRSLAKDVVLEFCQKYNEQFKVKFNTNAEPIRKEQIDALVKYVGDLPDESIRRDMGELVKILKGQCDLIAKDFLKSLTRIVETEYRDKNTSIPKFTTTPTDSNVSDLKNKLRDLENRQAESINEINRLRNDLKETVSALKSIAAEAKDNNKNAPTIKNETIVPVQTEPAKSNLNPYLLGLLFIMAGLLIFKFFRK